MNRLQYKLSSVGMTVLLLVAMLYVGREAAVYVTGSGISAQEEKKCVVIDAGHGGAEGRLKN